MIDYIKKINKKTVLFCSVGFVLFFILACLFPYSGDDWAWGSIIGIERLQCFFADYNGRYAGNLLVLILTRSKPLNAFFVSSSLVFSCVMIYKSLNEKKYPSLLLCGLLFLVMSRPMFAQSIVWTSGYTNYVPSIIMTMFCVIVMQDIFCEKAPKYPAYYVPIVALTAFLSCLFIETVTLLNIAIGVLIILYSLIKFKKLFITHLSFLFGSVIGAVCMFTNGAYTNIMNSEDEYRETALNGDTIDFIEDLFGHANEIFNGFVLNNLFIFFILSALCIMMGVVFVKSCKNKALITISIICSSLNAFTLLLLFFKKNNNFWRLVTVFLNPDYIGHLVFYLITTIFMLTLAVQILICVKEKSTRDKLILYIICVVGLILPLFLVTPIGPRCYFAPYFVIVMIIVTLFNYLTNEMHIEKTTLKHFTVVLTAVLLSAILFLFSVFIPINYYTGLRDEYTLAQSQVEGREKIYICQVPYTNYIWNGNPTESSVLAERYLLFHNIDIEKKLVYKNYEDFGRWAKRYNKKTGYKSKHKIRKTKSRFYRKADKSKKNKTVKV